MALGVAEAAAVAVIVCALFLAHQRRRRRCGASQPAAAPGGKPAIPSPFPFYSDLVIEVTRTGDFPDAVKLHAQHGPVFWWRFLGRRMLMVGGYEAAMRVLKGEHSIVEAEYPPSVKHMLGRWGMVNVSGKQHIRIKRLAQAAFTPRAIRGYLPRMQASAEEAVRKWEAEGDILAYPEFKWWTFRVAVQIILGFDESWTAPGPDGFQRVSALFSEWLDGLFSFPVAIPGTAFARGMKARAGLMQRIHASLDLLEQRGVGQGEQGNLPLKEDQEGVEGEEGTRKQKGAEGEEEEEEREEQDGEGERYGGSGEGPQSAPAGLQQQPTALDLLMGARDEHGGRLTREQIADSVLTMLFAGHDTSATTLTRIFHHLHAHPEAAERLRQEQAAALAKHGPVITEAALEDMPYAEGVVREAMRVTPIIAGFPRIALQDFELCGYTIPKGTRMQCSLAQPLLMDSRWAGEENPLAFKPERWLNGAAQKAGAWIPFGGGSRLCLGWLLAMVEMKVLLAVIFRSYSLRLTQPGEPWLLFPLARPKHGMPARFTRQDQAAAGQ